MGNYWIAKAESLFVENKELRTKNKSVKARLDAVEKTKNHWTCSVYKDFKEALRKAGQFNEEKAEKKTKIQFGDPSAKAEEGEMLELEAHFDPEPPELFRLTLCDECSKKIKDQILEGME